MSTRPLPRSMLRRHCCWCNYIKLCVLLLQAFAAAEAAMRPSEELMLVQKLQRGTLKLAGALLQANTGGHATACHLSCSCLT